MRIKILTTKSDFSTYELELPKRAGQPVVVQALGNSRMSLRIDGVVMTGKEVVGGKPLMLKRAGNNLLLQSDGETLVDMHDFYANGTTMLEGAGWSFSGADGLALSAGSQGVMPESAAVQITPTSGSAYLAGAVLGGLALGGSGPSNGASNVAAPVTYKLSVSAAAGPIKANVIMILSTEDGQRFSAISDENGKYIFDIPAGYKGTLLVTVKDLNGAGADYVDEATGASKSLNTQLRAMLVVDNTKNVSIVVSPVTELAARHAGLSDNDLIAPAASKVAPANQNVAKILGLDGIDIVQTLPELIIKADGTKNAAYNDTDGVSGAEKYAQVLAMLSGLDKTSGSVNGTLSSLAADLPDLTTLNQTQLATVLGRFSDKLIEGAKVFESNDVVDNKANLLTLAGVPTFTNRALNAPLDGTVASALAEANSKTGADAGELAPSADAKRYVNAAEAAANASGVAIYVPTPLPSGAIAGDVVTLTIANQDGSTRNVTYTVGSADVAAGVAQVPLTPAQLGADGATQISVQLRSADGLLTSPSYGVLNVVLDTLAPAVYTAGGQAGSLGAGNDFGTRDLPNFTSDKTPTITGGPVEFGATVELTLNGKTYSSAGANPSIVVAADGTWSLTVPATDALSGAGGAGVAYTPTIKVTDLAGNSSSQNGTPFAVYVDVSAVLDASSDTSGPAGSGSAADDKLTNDTTPTLVGKVPVGTAMLTVLLDGKTYSTDASDASGLKIALDSVTGVWRFTAQELSHDGVFTPILSITDLVGNVATVNGSPFTLDATAPATTGIGGGLDAASNTGYTSDTITSNATPTLSGRGEPGAAISIAIKNTAGTVVQTLTGTVQADGTWSLAVPTALADTSINGSGTAYTPAITLTDAAGNATTQSGTPFTLDTTGPSSTGFSAALASASNSGNGTAGSDTDTITNNTRPTLTGKAEAGAKVELTIGSQTYTTTADANGDWSVAITSPLVDSASDGRGTTFMPMVKLTDAAGTVTTIPNAFGFTLDTSKPTQADISASLATDAANQTGTDADGTPLTKDNTPVLSGTAPVGSVVEVTVGGVTYTSATPRPAGLLGGIQVAADGSWTLAIPTPLADGVQVPQITVADLAGNRTSLNGTAFRVDTSAPSALAISGGLSADAVNDTGAPADNRTNNIHPQLSGTAEPGSSVVVTLKSSIVGAPDVVITAVVATNGSWTADVPTASALADGTYTPSIAVTDLSGNSTTKLGSAFVVDATPVSSASPAFSAGLAATTGIAAGTTNNETPTLRGKAEAGAKVELTVGGQTYTTTADPSGNWSVAVTTPLMDSSTDGRGTVFQPTITLTDAAGNSTTIANALRFTLDTHAMVASAITGALEKGAGTTSNSGDNTDDLTSNRLPVLKGSAEAGSSVVVMVGGKSYPAAVDASGQWSVAVGSQANGGLGLSNGFYVPQIKVTDSAGNVTLTDGSEFQVDFNAPVLQTISGALASDATNDTGTLGDNKTNNPTPVLNGTGEAGASISIAIKDANGLVVQTLTGTVGADGNWTLPVTSALNGVGSGANGVSYTPYITLTDAAGNSSVAKAGTAFTIDTAKPGALTGGLALVSDTGLTDNVTRLTKPVLSGTAEAGSVVEITINGVSYTTTAASDSTWRVPLTTDLPSNTAFYTFSLKATDAAGNITTALPADITGFTVDITSPIGNVQLTGSSDSNPFATAGIGSGSDNVTNVSTPALQGSIGDAGKPYAAGDHVEVRLNGVVYSSNPAASGASAGARAGIAVDALGNWTFTAIVLAGNRDYLPEVRTLSGSTDTWSAWLNGLGFRVDDVAPDFGVTAALTRSASNDTGTLGDNLTRVGKPLFSGTAEGGSSVMLEIKSADGSALIARVGPILVGANGQWASTALSHWSGSALSDAHYSLGVLVTDIAGNTTAPQLATAFEVDTTGPSDSSTYFRVGLAEASNTGSTTDAITATTRPTLQGLAEAGAKVEVEVGGHTYTTTADSTGAWSVVVTNTLSGNTAGAAVEYKPKVTLTDLAGNVTVIPDAFAFTVDTVPPAASAVSSTLSTPSGIDGSMPLSKLSSPTLSGSAPPDSILEITIGGVTYTNASPTPAGLTPGIALAANGTWTLAVSSALADGVQVPQIRITDPAGNSTSTVGTAFRIDTVAPSAQAISAGLSSGVGGQTGISASGTPLTNDTTPLLSGTSEPGSTVSVSVGGKTYLGATDGSSPLSVNPTTGAWTLQIPPTDALTDSSANGAGTAYTPSITVTDKAGNQTTKDGVVFTLDATGPSSAGFTAALAAASNTGNGSAASATDSVTSSTRPTLTGSAEPGAKVEITLGTGANSKTYTTTADASGNWSVTVTTALADTATDGNGTVYSASVKLTDAAGASTTIPNAFSFTVDSAPPAPSSISAGLQNTAGNQTGVDSDGTVLTKDNTPILRGTASAGSVVEVTIGGVTYTSASPVPAGQVAGLVVAGDGSWTLQVPTALADGVQVPQIKVTDLAGNSTSQVGTPLRVDTSAPALQAISGALSVDADTDNTTANDSGTKGDNLTRHTTPTFNGTAEAGSSVVLTVRAAGASSSGAAVQTLPAQVADASGAWTATTPAALTGAGYSLWAEVTDKAGNTSTKQLTGFTVDTQAPTTVTGGLSIASDTGATDNITSNTTPSLSGTAEPGAKVVITLDGKTYETTANALTGSWSIAADALPSSAASYVPTITVTDRAGNVTAPIALTPFSINTNPPAVNGGLETGASAGTNSGDKFDTVTNNPLPTMKGTAEMGAAVQVTIDSVIYKTFASSVDGTWSITVGAGGVNGNNVAVAGHTLANGSYIPRIKVTNSVGVSSTADGTPFTVDFSAPALEGINGALWVDTAVTDNNLANDSGIKADNITRDTTPTFAGTAEAGSTVVLAIRAAGAAVTAPALQTLAPVTATNGSWQATAATALPSSGASGTSYSLWATVTDAAGNASSKQLSGFTIDATVPTDLLSGSLKRDAGNDTGTSQTDNQTKNASPVLTGKAEAGASIEVTLTGPSPATATKTYTTTVSSTGDWSLVVTDTLGQGGYAMALKATDKAGNVQIGTGTGFELDTTAPAAPTGGLPSGTNTIDTTPDLTGTAEAGSTVEVTINGVTYTNASPVPAGQIGGVTLTGGNWTLTIPADKSLPGGTYLPQVKVTDAAGNSTSANGIQFTVQVSLNGELVHDATNDTAGAGTTGTLSDNLTKNQRPKLSGSTPANSDVEVTINGVTYTSATPTGGKLAGVLVTGSVWEFSLPVNLPSQLYNWTVTSIDRANSSNTSTANGVPFTVDAIAPTAATATLALSSDSGDKGDNLTNVANPVLSGEAEPFASVEVVFNTKTYTARANAQGIWTVPTDNAGVALLSGTSYTPSIKVTDQAGNTTAANGSAISFDNVGPVVSSVAVLGLDGSAASRTVKAASALLAGDRIEVTVTLSETSAVVGKPTYTINVGGVDKVATYDLELSDPANKKLVFSYTVKTGDLDTAGGITAGAAALSLPTGVAIHDVAFNEMLITGSAATATVPATISTPAPVANTIAVDAVAPVLQSLVLTEDAGTDNTFVAGNLVTITASFDSAVLVSSAEQTGANRPYVNLRMGSSVAKVYYDHAATAALNQSGKLVFSYIVLPGDTDTNGLSLGASALSLGDASATIRDAAGNDARMTLPLVADNAALKVDTTAPTLEISRTSSATIKIGATETILFTFSEDPGTSLVWNGATSGAGAQTGDLTVTGGTLGPIGTATFNAATNTWQASATFTPAAGSTTTASVAVATARFVDPAGNSNSAASNTLSFPVDTVPPVLQSISVKAPDDATLVSGETKLTLVFTFSEDPGSSFSSSDIVAYDASNQLTALSGGSLGSISGTGLTREVDFFPNAQTSATVKLGVVPSTFQDLAGNNGTVMANPITLTVATATPKVLGVVIEAQDNTAANAADSGALVAGDKLIVKVTYDASVKLNTSAGSPSFALNVGGQLKNASLVTDSTKSTALAAAGGQQVWFEYTVTNTDLDLNDGGITASQNALQLGAATVVSSATSNAADSSTPSSGTGLFPANTINVDAVLPTVAMTVDAGINTLKAGETATLRFAFSEPVDTLNAGMVMLTDGTTPSANQWGSLGSFAAVAGSNSTIWTALYTPPTTAIDRTSVQIRLDNGKFKDAAGNLNADGADSNNLVTLTVDNKIPADPVIFLSNDTARDTTNPSTNASNPNTVGTGDRVTSNTALTTTGVEASAQVQYKLVKNSDNSVVMNWGALADYNAAIDAAATGLEYKVLVRQTDLGGNTSAGTRSLVFTKDTAVAALVASLNTANGDTTTSLAPAGPVAGAANDQIDYLADKITSNKVLTIGAAEAGAQVQFKIGSNAWTNASDSTSPSAIANQVAAAITTNGSYTISLRQVDAAGNISDVSQVELTWDNTAPSTLATGPNALSGALQAIAASDSGALGDNITNKTAPTLVGTGEPGAWVQVVLKRTGGGAADVTLTPVQIDSSGNWIVSSTALADGVWTPNITIQDQAGNSATASRTAFTVDTTAPTLAISAAVAGAPFDPASTKLKSGQSALIAFTFNEDVTDFTEADIAVSGGTLLSLTRIDSKTFTASFFPVAGVNAGSGSVQVGSTRYKDMAYNDNSAAASFNFSYDTSAPSLASISRGTTDGTAAALRTDAYLNADELDAGSTATFVLAFTEAVGGLTAANFALRDQAGTAVTGASISSVVANAPDAAGRSTGWTVTVANLDQLSSVSLRLDLTSANAITDTSGNVLAQATFSNGQVYTLDRVAPTLAAITSGGFASTASPTLNGAAEPGSTMTIVAGGATYNVPVNAAGQWTLDLARATPQSGSFTAPVGTLGFTYQATDPAGNSGPVGTGSVAINALTPTISTSGSTNDSSPFVTGSAPANASVRVTIGGATYNVTANGSGLWTVDTETVPSSGTFSAITNGTYSITAVNLAGGSTASSTLLIDLVAPAAPQITSSPITNDTTPVLTGRAEANTLVQVQISGATFTVRSDANGNWSVDTGLTDLQAATAGQSRTGTYTAPNGAASANGSTTSVTVTTIDDAGNASTPVTQTLRVDTVTPTAPFVDGTQGSLTSADNSPTITGKAEPGATVSVVIGGATFKVIADVSGNYAVDVGIDTPVAGAYAAPTNGGTVSATITQTDAAGNGPSAAITKTYTLDDTGPSITSTPYTNDTTPVVAGTAQPGATVTVTINGSQFTVTANASGIWNVNTETAVPLTGSFTPLTNGQQLNVTAAVVGKASAELNLTCDTVAPTKISINVVASDDFVAISEQASSITGNVEVGSSVTLTLGSNTRQATVKSDGTWSYQLIADDIASMGQSAPGVTADKSVIAVARDKAGNTKTASRNITIDSIAPAVDLDRADALDNNYAVALTGKNTEYSLDNGSTVTVTDAKITEANPITKVQIAFGRLSDPANAASSLTFVPQDGGLEQMLVGDKVLALDGQNLPASVQFAGVTWLVNYSAGTFSFTASTSQSSELPGQALLRNVRYINKSAGAVDGAQADRVFKFTVFDQAGNAALPVTSTVTTDSVGPAIDLNGAGTAGNDQAYTYSGTAARALVDVSSASVFEPKGVTLLSISAMGLQDGTAEQLIIAGANGGSLSLNANGSGVAANTAATLGGVAWVVNYNAGAFVLSRIDGSTVTAAQAQSLINALQYRNTSATPTDGARVFGITGQDGVGNLTATPALSTITLNTQAPTANALGSAVFTPASSNAPAQNSNGRMTTLDANEDGVLGDQFKLTFSELVQVTPLTNVSNWTLSAGTLGTDATITAVNPTIVNGVQYARGFLFTGGTGYSYTTGTTLTIAAANVVDTSTATAAANVTFTVTDIVAPAAATPPLNINQNSATSPNIINATEKTASTAVGNFALANAAVAGDVLKVYIDGVWLKDVSLSAGATTASFTLSGIEWGSTDGPRTITTRLQDAAGNLGVATSPKSVLLDTVIASGIQSMVFSSDNAPTGVANTGDKVLITFNEALNFTAGSLPAAFGTGAVVAAIGGTPTAGLTGSTIKSTTWEVTLGSSPTLAGGQSITLSGLSDHAGNTGTITTTVPADVFNAPLSILVNNVTSDNVINASERSSVSSVGVTLAGAKAGDVVTLYMGGVAIGSATVATDGVSSATVSLNAGTNWGADGERALTASIQRGSGSVITSDARMVSVAADGAHWSTGSGIIWFDPDTMVQTTGTSVLTWNASVGGSVATVDQTVVTNGLYRPKLVRNSVNGHNQIYFNGGLAGSLDTANGSWMNFTDPNTYFALNTSNRAYTVITNAQYAETGNWRYVTEIGSYGQGLGSGGVGFGVESSGTALFALQHQNPPYITPANSNTLGSQILASHVYTPGTQQLYSNGALIGSKSTNYSIILGTGNAAQRLDQYVIGGSSGAQAGGVQEVWKGMIGDIIWANRAITGNELLEINTYEAAKYGTIGTRKSPTTSEAIYDLSVSANAGVLLDDVLTLHSSALGAGNDTVTVAGADYVTTGAGKDMVLAKDLKFRSIDGGLGFDTFALHSNYTGGTFNLTDYVSNALAQGLDSSANVRVNANGYHKLLGFEKLDFSQSTAKQTITIAAADVDQLAEKNLAGDPQAAANTSDLYVVLGSNDYLATTGLGSVQYGYWLDYNGTAYDRKYTATGGLIGAGDTANLFARSGDDAPDFGFTATAGTYSSHSMALDFSEGMGITGALNTSDFQLNGQAAGVGISAVTYTTGNLAVSTSDALTGAIRLQYTGLGIVDAQGDQLRYKDITLGSSGADVVDASAYSQGVALIGNNGNDQLTGSAFSDLLMGGAGNDTLEGKGGADTFRFIQFEAGTDTIKDFTKSEGDKIDLRGVLKGSGFDNVAFSNLGNYVQLSYSGTTAVLKVDDQGIGNFSQPGLTVNMLAAATPTNMVADLQTLIDQRVLLV